ncbi:nitrate- and nitrite sensing domain-containing protein [Paractinoplanes ferrugineus]|uniref:histidine kinase n=1 Tax=Paractinoplanes ferrugineus TaxID=113564 RepID=A0A919JBQ0_9ACTN|nr:ATP-binding protein [Actinoplanes ferrugineus]GIE14211.1 hypothetical protein Afe05nite_60510 [Actinoplanes ferrugineus]
MLLVTLPVALVLALTAFTAVTSLSATAQTGVARQLVDVGVTGSRLSEQLQRERAAAALVFAQASSPEAIEAYRQQGEVTDRARASFVAAEVGLDTSTGPATVLRRLDTQLAALPLLREQVRSGRDATQSLVVFRYGALISGLLGFGQALSQTDVDSSTADRFRAVSTLARSIEALGVLQVTVVPALSAGEMTPAAQQQVIAADAAFTDSQESFRQLAPPVWQALLTSQPGGKQILAGERLQGVVVQTDASQPLDLGVRPAGWVNAMNARMQQLHQLEDQLLGEELAAVTRERDRQRRDTLVLGILVLTCLVTVAVIGWWVTRSMTAPLVRAAGEATGVALSRLPTMERRLNERGVSRQELDEAIEVAARPLPVPGHDEIGVVIAAFNDVLAIAARIAAGQAQYREIVAEAFKTQAYEQQRRIDAITASLDVQEKSEEDSQRLQRLFQLDQQVTTLLRSIGTLQLFAGGRVGRPRQEPVRLTDVVTAAVGRVEGYERVEHAKVELEVMVSGDLVDELIHLLAELLHNALRYSAKNRPVEVTARPKQDRLYLEIRDYGLGLNAEQQQDMQHRIENFTLDEFTARHYGLATVGLIATRRDITVRLNSLAKDGTSVEIAVPSPLFWRQPVALPPPPPPSPPPAAPRAVMSRPEVTMQLPAVSPRTRMPTAVDAATPSQGLAVAEGPQPDWPMPRTAAPIYDTVAAGHPLFNPGASADQVFSRPVTVEFLPAKPPPPRQAATTAGGLPVRVPGRTAYDPPPASAVIPQQRDPEAAVAQWSSFGAGSADAFAVPK